MKNINSNQMLDALNVWREQNNHCGVKCYWRRKSVLWSMLQQKFGKNKVVSAPLFFGEAMHILTGETTSQQILSFGYSEVALSALMITVINQGDAVVDIGTHYGYEAILAATLVGDLGSVDCFEPQSDVMALARKNFDRFPQIYPHLMALGADDCFVVLLKVDPVKSAFASIVKNSPEIDSVEAPMSTLDNVLRNRSRKIKFLKADVEGYELEVLKGANSVITEDRPLLVFEVGMRNEKGFKDRISQLTSVLEKFGYEPFDFEYQGILEVGPLGEIEVNHANVGFRYVENEEINRRIGFV